MVRGSTFSAVVTPRSMRRQLKSARSSVRFFGQVHEHIHDPG